MNLNQVTVSVTDLDRAVAFYKTLGLHLIVYSDHGYARFECGNGATFSLQKVDDLSGPSPTTIYFECEDLDQRVSALKAAGLKFDQDAQDEAWLWREAKLSDPDGNLIKLYWAGENRLNPPWRLMDDA